MTCYLRLHEVLLGVRKPKDAIEWPAAFKAWQDATSVLDREHILDVLSLEPVDVYDLPHADLSAYSGLIVSDRVDQEFLYEHRSVIADFLGRGKVMAVSGELYRPWLPNQQLFRPFARVQGAAAGAAPALEVTDHPILDGLTADDIGRGFAYGHHPLPKDAEVLVRSTQGEASMYVDRASTDGAILLHAGHTLMGYATAAAESKRLVPQLLRWILAEGDR